MRESTIGVGLVSIPIMWVRLRVVMGGGRVNFFDRYMFCLHPFKDIANAEMLNPAFNTFGVPGGGHEVFNIGM